jgi:macrolide-specific efflux system membrane fusion protein
MDRLLTKGKSIWSKIVLVGCLAAFVSGCSLLPKEEEALKPPLFEPPQENHETMEVKRGNIAKQVRGVAVFESVKSEYYQFEDASGKLKEIHVKPGDKVKKGDLLVELELENLELALLEHELNLERAKLALQQTIDAGDTASLKIRRLELKIAQMRYDDVVRQIEDRKIYAGIDGQVVFVEELRPGDWVDAGRMLVSVADPKQLRLSYQGDGNTIREVEVGMEAHVIFGGKDYKGEVVQTPSSAPPTDNDQLREKYSRTLYMNLPEIPGSASIGQTADFIITTQMRENVIKIPKRGLRSYLGRNYVQVLEDNSIREIDVEKGIETATEVEIVQGLKEGQLVILQ